MCKVDGEIKPNAIRNAVFEATENQHSKMCKELATALRLPWNGMCWKDMLSYVMVLRRLHHLQEQDPVAMPDYATAADSSVE